MIHYYASPGVDDLTEDDYLTSQYPYRRHAERFETLFFNFCNKNDGQTWSTPFLIDDPRLYVVHSNRIVSIVNSKKQFLAKQQAEKQQAALLEARRAEEAARAAEQGMSRTARRLPDMSGKRRTKPAPDPAFDMGELYE